MKDVKQGKRSLKRPTLKHKTSLKVIGLTILLVILAVLTYFKVYPYTSEAKTTKQLEQTQVQLIEQRKQLETQILHNKKLDQKTKEQIQDLNKQIEEKDKQIQAKALSQKAYAESLPTPTGVDSCESQGSPKAYIYCHESGNSTTAVNSIGCRGLGQACPGDKLPCGADYACQDAWFTNYAMERYGSWEAAKTFWVNNHWW